MTLKVFICNSFEGHYPVGTAAVIVAANKEEAIKLLDDDLTDRNLQQTLSPDDIRELDTSVAHSCVLNDGEY